MGDRTTENQDSISGTRILELLAKLEKGLETPVVSGELSSWLTAIQETADQLIPELRAHYEQTHQEQLDEMGEQDGGLLPRVEQLQQEDHDILSQADQFVAYLQEMHRALNRAETGETEMHDRQQEFSTAGIAWVVRARAQEAAMETWYAEAMERDRGVVD